MPLEPNLHFHEHNRAALRAASADTLVLLPAGATEQHGPHLPVGTDWLVVEHIARAAAALAAAEIPILVAPTLPYGCSQHHLPFGGTLSLTTETYFRVVSELVESLIISGFGRVFILNGHGGNHELVQLVARDLALKYPVSVAAGSYWVMAWDALIQAGAHQLGRFPGHAGAFETAEMLALWPELVASERPKRETLPASDLRGAAPPYRAEYHGSWQRIDGYTDSPALARAEQGQRYFEAIIPVVCRSLVNFYHSVPASAPGADT
jgi:creatinine amidohydrolase